MSEDPKQHDAAAPKEVAASGQAEAGAGEPSVEVKATPASEAVPEVEAEEPAVDAGTGQTVEAAPRRRSLPPYLGQAAVLARALALGWLGGSGSLAGKRPETSSAHEALLKVDWSALSANVEQSQAEAARFATEMQALKASLSLLKETLDRSKQELNMRLAGVTERLDNGQRTEQEIATKIAGVLDRLERPERDAAVRLIPAIEAKLGPLADRLDRIERQSVAIANTVTAGAPGAAKQAPAVPEPAQTASLASKGKPPVVEGWVIRDVYNGIALVEGRNQRLIEVSTGQNLPGVGRVEAIERRGKSWVVVTAKGIITSQHW